eukprot:TRINITY_DN27904_c0_g1_i1.p1 TRINITY_DN27904_c0_g1~~TRINITY_DN27904_c0_g1_i1.p1  ORF type:complete len:159 (+),score=15.66 TRINITY_DN27904_c0_g1_i1:56-532(+)
MADISQPPKMDSKAIAEISKQARALMVNHYYAAWDSGIGEARIDAAVGQDGRQHSKLYKIYSAEADICWNGHQIKRDNMDHLFEALKTVRTKHTINQLDVQPLSDLNHFLVSIHGQCLYDSEITRGFSHIVIWWKEIQQGSTPKYWLVHDNFRWTTGL